MNYEDAILSTHPSYEDRYIQWITCRDAFDGERAIKSVEHREEYLPRLGGQEGRDYENYIARAVFHPVVSTVVNGRTGQVFYKSPQFEMDDNLLDWGKTEVTKQRQTLNGAIKTMLREVLTVGRVGVLVDIDRQGGDPYLAIYKAEDITNWKQDDMGLTHVTLCEYPVDQKMDQDGNYFQSVVKQYRHLMINEEGRYTQIVYRMHEGDLLVYDEVEPTQNGSPLDFIPFTFINASDISPMCEKPPLFDLASINIAHYRNSADYEQCLHMLAVPTPYGTGLDEDEALDTLGPLNFKAIRNENAKLGLLEFSGRGTESLKEAMAEKMSVMASIGGSLVQKQRKQVESAETARIRTASETSALETICDTIEQASEQMLGYVSKWMGWSEEIEVSLNRDFTNERWDPADIKAITEAEMMGVISKETAFYQRKLLEFYPDKRTFEDEQELIAMNAGPPEQKEMETHTMDPRSHVIEQEEGTFGVADVKGNIVSTFDSKVEAEQYAIDNHNDLMAQA
jgi:hypothetical protein